MRLKRLTFALKFFKMLLIEKTGGRPRVPAMR